MQKQGKDELSNNFSIELYDRYASTIFAYIRQHTASREDAEDLTLEVFTAALERNNLSELLDREKLAWLRRVAQNKLVDSYRRLHQHPTVTLDEATMDAMMYDDDALSPEYSSLKQEEYGQLYQALRSLSLLQQQVLRLRYGDELRFAEIAIMLNKREDAVRKVLSRALATLRTIYEKE